MTNKEAEYNNRLLCKREEMTSKFCAILKDNCTEKCIHFYRGFVFEHMGYWSIKVPYCKLWRD